MDVSLAIPDALVELATVGEEYDGMKERVFEVVLKAALNLSC
jgi:hypothetical protein